jgi:Beta-lactamase enzyme family
MLHLLAALLAILGGGLHHPARLRVAEPRSFEVWDGRLQGHAPGIVHVRAGGHRYTLVPGPGGRFSVRVPRVPRGDATVTIAGRRIPVYGLSPGSLRPLAPARDDRRLDRVLGSLAAGAGPAVAAYVHRAGGRAGAWNAGAEFEGASTLKLPIMVTALERIGGEPRATPYWAPFEAITRWSSNEAADEALELLGGSEAGGAADMVAAMRGLGLRHTYLYGGYLTDPDAGGGPPPVDASRAPPPSFKYTTAADMARLAAWLADAAAGSGPLTRHGVTRHEARELLYLMLHAADPGLVRPGAAGRPVAHKIGWLETSRDDVAIVFTRHGPVVVTVYAQGTIDASVYAFARAVARAALPAAGA